MTTGYVAGAPVSVPTDLQEAIKGAGPSIRRKFLRFIDSGNISWTVVDDSINNEVEVTATAFGIVGPPGPTGPAGSTGPAGPAGPPGPGFSSSASTNSGTINTSPAGAGSLSITPGFTIRAFNLYHGQVQLFGGSDGVTITSVTGLGSGTLTVFWSTNDAPFGGATDLQVRLDLWVFG